MASSAATCRPASCRRLCQCQATMARVEDAVAAGASFDQCMDELSDALRCSAIGTCVSRLAVSDRAASLVMSMLKRGDGRP